MKLEFDTQHEHGCGDIPERILMYALATMIEAKTIVEMGVAKGDGFYWLAKAAETTGGHAYGFDCWSRHGQWMQFEANGSKQQVEERMQSHGLNRFSLFEVDAGVEGFSLYDHIGPKLIDFASIDGDHSYQGVKKDFEHCEAMLSPYGIILLHDCMIIDGVREFMLELEQSSKYFMHTLPYGCGSRRAGVTIVQRRISSEVLMDEVCGSHSTLDEIYAKERGYWGFTR